MGRRYSPFCLSVDAIGVSVARLRAGVQSKVHSLSSLRREGCGGGSSLRWLGVPLHGQERRGRN